jgi:hypothetical protein
MLPPGLPDHAPMPSGYVRELLIGAWFKGMGYGVQAAVGGGSAGLAVETPRSATYCWRFWPSELPITHLTSAVSAREHPTSVSNHGMY